MEHLRKIVFMALLTSISLVIWVIEAQIPAPVPVPGIKLGLASVITLTAMVLLGRKEALVILVMRVVLASLFAGSFSAILFSLAGGLLSWAVMALVLNRFPRNLLWVVSVLGAIAHNAGQLLAAIFVTRTPSLLAYGPVLLAAAILTGVFTGAASQALTKALGTRLPLNTRKDRDHPNGS